MTIRSLLTLVVALSWFVSCGNTQAENATETGLSTPEQVEEETANTPALADTEFADAITDKVFQNYLHLRSALVDSDATEASKVAAAMSTSLEQERPAINTIARRIANSDNLAVQRAAFAELTPALEPLFTEGIRGGTFYKMHCPMAFDGKGGDWFSEIDQVRNPFYGEKMLTCGTVMETITN